MGCCLGSQEHMDNETETHTITITEVPHRQFREGRNEDDFSGNEAAKKILHCICATLCLYKPSGFGLILSFLLALTCVFQLVYDIFVICGCPGFDCGFLEKKLEESKNTTSHSSFRKTSNTVYTLASIGGFFSYTLLLASLLALYHRRKTGNNNAIGPSDVLYKDLSNSQVKVIFTSQIVMAIFFVASVVMFYYLVRSQPRDGWYFYLMVTGVAAQFIAQWAAIVGCHVFAMCSLALGTLANDTIRRIKNGIEPTTGKQGRSYGATESITPSTATPSPTASPSPTIIASTITTTSVITSTVSSSVSLPSPTTAVAPTITTTATPTAASPTAVTTTTSTVSSSVSSSTTAPAVSTTVTPSSTVSSSTTPSPTATPTAVTTATPTTASTTTAVTTTTTTTGARDATTVPTTTRKPNPEAIEAIDQLEHSFKAEPTKPTSSDRTDLQKSFDVALGYHEELCSLVSDTVSAYCPWFVIHWIFYGATCLIGVIYISEEWTYSKNPIKLAYVTTFLVTHLYMFLLPCCCAAYITDSCGGIYSRINRTVSTYWPSRHPFRHRDQLMLFTSYAKDRQCVFKIGRLTFTSTLAWISLLLGSTGLLFHFF